MKTTTSLTVRSYECDHYGHVNNANYLHYLEYARCEFLKEAGFPYYEAVAEGYGLYVARVEIDYKKPAFPDDLLHIDSWPIKKGAVSGIIGQTIRRGSDTLVEAKVTWAFVDSKGIPCRVPDKYNLSGLSPEI